jgi:hypothetical protein
MNYILTADNSNFEDLFSTFKSNPKKFIDEQNKAFKGHFPKIGGVEFHPNNCSYDLVNKSVKENYIKEEQKILEISETLIHSGVLTKDKFILRIHNSTTISISNDSHLRFCPHGKNGLEISRVYVLETNQGKGDGTFLMNFLYKNILRSVGQFPEIMLECTGQVGSGENELINSITKQTKFFRRFGFRVSQSESKHPHYVKMKFDLTKLVDY